MSKIYTKTGDKGQTSLMDGSRVPKNHIRVETYGTIDELNSILGVALSHISANAYAVLRKELEQIQKDLFEVGSMLANPSTNNRLPITSYFDNRVLEFEKQIDAMTEKLPLLTNFILPGGGKAGASLHLARTVARRAERRITELAQKESVEPSFIKYINRLSDLLFTMSRFVNFKEKKKETIWNKLKMGE